MKEREKSQRSKSQVNLNSNVIKCDQGMDKMEFTTCQQLNHFEMDDADVPAAVKPTFNRKIGRMINAFTDVIESLPYNINSIATIRTDGEPVYSKLYPYPMGVSEFVNAEVKQLLVDGIIRQTLKADMGCGQKRHWRLRS